MTRSILFAGIVAVMTALIQPVYAQVKKPKQPAVTVKQPVIKKIDFWVLTPDDAVQIVNDELKKMNIVLQNIEEEPSYYYNVSGKKTGLRFTTRKLYFDNEISGNIIADEKDHITELSFSVNSGNLKHVKAIKKMLGYESWPVIAQSNSDTTYRNNNTVGISAVYTGRNDDGAIISQSFDATIKQVTPYTYQPAATKSFDPKNLSVYDNGDDIGFAIVEFMKRLGINLLYKDHNLPFVIEKELYSYSCKYKFSNAVSVSINTSPVRKLKSIYIDSDDPITFSKLKKVLGILQWSETKRDDNDESDAVYYGFKNVVSGISAASKDIVFNIKPLPDDIATRLENTSTPTFDELAELYQSGTSNEVAISIAEQYVTGVRYDVSAKKLVPDPGADKFVFYFKTPDGSTATCIFNYNSPVFNRKSLEIYLTAADRIYMKEIVAQQMKGNFKSKYSYSLGLSGRSVTYPADFEWAWFSNKTVRAQELAAAAREEAEIARRKEQERQDAILKQKQKDAKSMEMLNLMGEILKSGGKKQ